MCTKEEAYSESVKAVEDVLFTKHNGKTKLETEMESAIYRSVGKWFLYGGVLIVLSVASLYYTNRQELLEVRQLAEKNTEAINEGGRYTQEEADRDNAAFQKQLDDMDDKLDLIINFLDD
jgi:hypothetical protein